MAIEPIYHKSQKKYVIENINYIPPQTEIELTNLVVIATDITAI